ncbi:MAG: hypothetical protein FJ288_03945 [Planctomycetes bacterium]|nr:hypothetical protein [Planctomycetota bacterium]
MDELEAVERLVRQARREAVPPPAGAAEGVLARLRAGAGRPLPILPLSMLAAAAAVAAAVVLALAIQAWTAGADPQAALFPTLEVATL